MTKEQFIRKYYDLIESYQFIEFNLEGIYAAICGKRFIDGLEDVERASLHQLCNALMTLEKQNNTCFIGESMYRELLELCRERNYWVHESLTTMAFDRHTDAPKKDTDILRLRTALTKAQDLSTRTEEIKWLAMRNSTKLTDNIQK